MYKEMSAHRKTYIIHINTHIYINICNKMIFANIICILLLNVAQVSLLSLNWKHFSC